MTQTNKGCVTDSCTDDSNVIPTRQDLCEPTKVKATELLYSKQTSLLHLLKMQINAVQ